MGTYNKAVTGSATEMPWTTHYNQYCIFPPVCLARLASGAGLEPRGPRGFPRGSGSPNADAQPNPRGLRKVLGQQVGPLRFVFLWTYFHPPRPGIFDSPAQEPKDSLRCHPHLFDCFGSAGQVHFTTPLLGPHRGPGDLSHRARPAPSLPVAVPGQAPRKVPRHWRVGLGRTIRNLGYLASHREYPKDPGLHPLPGGAIPFQERRANTWCWSITWRALDPAAIGSTTARTSMGPKWCSLGIRAPMGARNSCWSISQVAKSGWPTWALKANRKNLYPYPARAKEISCPPNTPNSPTDPGRLWKMPAYAGSVQPPLTPEIIAQAEAQLGVTLPEAYLEILRFQNGGVGGLRISRRESLNASRA